jgi:hypothetical protein
MKLKTIILSFFIIYSNSQNINIPAINIPIPNINIPAINIPNLNITIGGTLPFKDGDSVYIQSTAITRSNLWSKFDNCKDKKTLEICGDVKGFFGPNPGVYYIIRKGPDNLFCLELAGKPGVYLYLKDVKDCELGNNYCGSVTNIVYDQCRQESAFNIIPINVKEDCMNGSSFVVLQSAVNSKVVISFVAKDCADQIGEGYSDRHECGSVKGRYIDVNKLIMGDYEVFRMVPS